MFFQGACNVREIVASLPIFDGEFYKLGFRDDNIEQIFENA
jgi:hypothetical protein